MPNRRHLTGIALVAILGSYPAAVAVAPPVAAAVAIAVNGSTVTSDPGTSTFWADTTLPGWIFSLTGVTGTFPNKLDSTTLNVSSTFASPHTLTIDVSSNGDNTTGLINLLNSLTANDLAPGWSVDFYTWAGNGGLFDKAFPLASTTLVDIGTFQKLTPWNAPGNDSYTAEYVIHATGIGDSALLSAKIAAVPEPTSLALLGGALLGAGLFRRRAT